LALRSIEEHVERLKGIRVLVLLAEQLDGGNIGELAML
jgi:hypothetical protein